jgi:DNA sulfur modification protein DndE
MKVVFIGVIAMLAAFGLMVSASAQNAQAGVRIFLAGDSTVSNYKPEAPQRGWGQVLDRFFNKNVTIVNLAASGASTKTFRSIGRWDKLLSQLKPGDYVMCQFGHNDSSRDKVKAKGTDAGTEYQANLKKFIEEVKSKGAAIILVTPMHRGTFQADGKITQDLLPYVEAMRKVAKENNITLIDIYTPSGEYLEKIGPDDIAPIFCGIKNDKTHFSEKGALVMAEFVVKGIAVAKHPLTEYLKQ